MTSLRISSIFSLSAAAFVLTLTCWASESASGDGAESEPRRRRPIAAALIDDGKFLCVANQRSGSVSLIETATSSVRMELLTGRRLSDLVLHPDGRHLLVTDEAAHQLIVLQYVQQQLRVRARLPVSPYPVCVEVSADGSQCFVASLWSRRLSVVDLRPLSDETPQPKLRITRSIALPFAPRKLLLVRGRSKLVVTDSFGGKIAVVDAVTVELESERELPAHNIRGLAVGRDGRKLLVSHQLLNPLARTSFDDVHWGNLVSNVVRSLSLESVLDPKADLLTGSQVYRLGTVGNAAGDPAGLVFADLRLLVTLAGVNEIAVMPLNGSQMRRLKVGRRPTAVVTDKNERRAFVVNTFSDSITVLDLKRMRVTGEVSLGRRPEPDPRERGELLFFNARASHDGWFSCHSCHTDGHTSGLLADTLGDGSYGTPKRILSLLGVRDTDRWAWNGSIKELQDQIHKSVRTTMHGKPITDRQANDIVAFLHTLSSPPPVESGQTSAAVRASIQRGRKAFGRHNCRRCHLPLTYTTPDVYDVGLVDEAGNRKFNPPSLRGSGQRTGFFHDKRASTLEKVFTIHGHQLDKDTSAEELADLVRFLRTL